MAALKPEAAGRGEAGDQPLIGSGAILARVSLVASVSSLFFLGLAAFVALADLHTGLLANVGEGGVTFQRHLASRLLQAFLALCLWGVGCGVASLLLPHGTVNRRPAGIAGLVLGVLLPLLAWLLTVASVRVVLAQQAGRLY